MGFLHPDAERSLFPHERVFNKFFDGVVTPKMEQWFEERVKELQRGYYKAPNGEKKPAKGMMSGNDWRKALRVKCRYWYS